MKQTSISALAALFLTSPFSSAATLTSGHVDAIGIAYDSGSFDLHSHAEADAIVDGSPVGNAPDGVEFSPGALTFQTSTTTLRSADAAWDAVGVAAGQSYWVFPETSLPDQPFIGIGAEELIAADWTTPITITLTGMTGPAGGHFSIQQTDGLGIPTFFMSTFGGISAADGFSLDLNVEDHAHFGWGFTAEGTYELTFEIAGTHVTDGPQSASATYSFSVVPEPSTALLGAFGALALLRRRRTERGMNSASSQARNAE